MNRRSALKTLAAGSLLPLAGVPARALDPLHPLRSPAAFNLGIATYSLRGLPLDNALEVVKRLGLDSVSVGNVHVPKERQPEAWRSLAAKMTAAGVPARCYGVLYLENDETVARQALACVQALGVKVFSCSIAPAGLPLLEKLVQEYDLHAAIHNHGPEDKSWSGGPSVIWRAIESLHPRVGLCLDVGHCYRAGEDPAQAVRLYRSRLYDMHLKDSAANVGASKDVPVEAGRGRLDLGNILTALIEADYRENVWFEYEKDPNDPVPGLAESVGYVRGLLRGLSAS
jgi:sugar phosphate isomerase/epimerase